MDVELSQKIYDKIDEKDKKIKRGKYTRAKRSE